MDWHQRSAVEHLKPELIETLKGLTSVLFLSYLEANSIISADERELIEKSAKVTRDQLLKLLESLQRNDKGWSAIINYLRGDNKNALADKLEKTATKLFTATTDSPLFPAKFHGFCHLLADYYQQYYAHLLTLWESPDHVKDVWIELSIDSKREEFEEEKPIDHRELLAQLKSTRGRQVALIKGDPGAGKTTLVKKLAYDWAINYVSSANNQFSLVLAVPLRSVGKFTDFVQLAIDYFLSTINLSAVLNYSEDDRSELLRLTRGLGEKLLIIVDGLDEFGSYADSPFKNLYSQPFDTDAVNCRFTPSILSFKLIITSRPYACNRINMEFFPLRYRILPLDKENFGIFIHRYCRTEAGRLKALRYAKVHDEVIVEVPLILIFVCYLADSSPQDIPSRLTRLYDSFLYQMVRRAKRDNKLTEKIVDNNWKRSVVARTTAELAFQHNNLKRLIVTKPTVNTAIQHFTESQFEFDQNDMQRCDISNDSFSCGFLMHKYEFAQERLKAEFPHRSIKDFFSALHCYRLFLERKDDAKSDIISILFQQSETVGRFFLGICSVESQFEAAVDWLEISFDNPYCIQNLCEEQTLVTWEKALFDCAEKEHMYLGAKFFDTSGSLAHQLIAQWKVCGRLQLFKDLETLSGFAKGLRLTVLPRSAFGYFSNWFVADSQQPREAQIAYFNDELPPHMSVHADSINLLIWSCHNLQPVSLLDAVKQSDCFHIRTLIMDFGYSDLICVLFAIVYTGVPTQSLTNVRLGCTQRPEYSDCLNNFDLTGVAVSVLEASDEKVMGRDNVTRSFYRCSVVIATEMSQSAIISSLIKWTFSVRS